jgi:hypothetical protein
MTTLLIALIGLQVFPDNSQNFTAYAITGAGSVITCQSIYFTEIALGVDKSEAPYFAVFGGLLGGCVCHYLFRNHFSTDIEHDWATVGKGHGLIFNIGWCFAIDKILKKKEYHPTIEVMGERMWRHETIEYDTTGKPIK